MKCCEQKGHLSYIVMWILRKHKMNGAEIAGELEKRRGKRPSPGTVYPVLKDLRNRKLIVCDKEKRYSLTALGKREMKKACCHFSKMFYDFHEMLGFGKN